MTNEERINIIKKLKHYFSIETSCNYEKRQKKLMENLNDFIKFSNGKLGEENKSRNYKLICFFIYQ